jgi:hypothetical protein
LLRWCWGVQCRPGTTRKRLFADKQTPAMAPASGGGRSDLCSQKWRWSHNQDLARFGYKLTMNYIYIDIFYIFG